MRKILLFFLLGVTGCIGWGDMQKSRKLSGNYYLFAMDSDIENMNLSESDDRIGFTPIVDKVVYAAGINDKYIIVKQHPNNDRSTTNYYILPLKGSANYRTNNGLMGPLTLQQFNQIEKELDIATLPFTIVYKELE